VVEQMTEAGFDTLHQLYGQKMREIAFFAELRGIEKIYQKSEKEP
jgi:hypothetical protein